MPVNSIPAASLQDEGLWESLFQTLLALPFQTPGCGPHTGQMTLLSGRPSGQCPRVLDTHNFPMCQSVTYVVILKNSGPRSSENMHFQTHCRIIHMQ